MILQQLSRTQWRPTARVPATLPTNREISHESRGLRQNITPVFCCVSMIPLCQAKLPPNAESRLPLEALLARTRVPFLDLLCYTTKRKLVLGTHHSWSRRSTITNKAAPIGETNHGSRRRRTPQIVENSSFVSSTRRIIAEASLGCASATRRTESSGLLSC